MRYVVEERSDLVNHLWYGEDGGDPNDGGTGDPNGDPNGSGGTGDPNGGGTGDPKPKLFTQEEVNKIMANNRRNLQTKVAELEAQLTEAKSGSLTAEEKIKFQQRVKELSDSLKTKEELAKQEQERIRMESEQKINDLTNRLNTLQDRYTNETLTRAITDAAVVNEAFAPEQIVAILRPNTTLVEELDKDGNPTGNLIAKAKITGKDKDGKDTELDLSVPDAVAMMKKMPERYGNLFKATVNVGLGLNPSVSGTGSNSTDIKKMSPEQYMKARREGKIDLSKM